MLDFKQNFRQSSHVLYKDFFYGRYTRVYVQHVFGMEFCYQTICYDLKGIYFYAFLLQPLLLFVLYPSIKYIFITTLINVSQYPKRSDEDTELIKIKGGYSLRYYIDQRLFNIFVIQPSLFLLLYPTTLYTYFSTAINLIQYSVPKEINEAFLFKKKYNTSFYDEKLQIEIVFGPGYFYPLLKKI